MKIEFQHQYNKRHRLPIARAPRGLSAALCAVLRPYGTAREFAQRLARLARLGDRVLGLADKRSLPEWRRDILREPGKCSAASTGRREVVLFADTFTS